VAEFDPISQRITGRRAYFLDVPGAASAAAMSVVSFEATEQMGAPTEVRIVVIHPLQLARTEYLKGKPCTRSIHVSLGWHSILLVRASAEQCGQHKRIN
jgi:uncharacterized protein involved in type VI secretion and phage assembly